MQVDEKFWWVDYWGVSSLFFNGLAYTFHGLLIGKLFIMEFTIPESFDLFTFPSKKSNDSQGGRNNKESIGPGEIGSKCKPHPDKAANEKDKHTGNNINFGAFTRIKSPNIRH